MRPCLDCGEPSPGSRCSACKLDRDRQVNARQDERRGTPSHRGYGTKWSALSRRARKAQPWCQDCGTDQDLSLDHLPGSWERVEQGKVLRLGVDVEVVCRSCNSKRGAARHPSATRGEPRHGERSDPRSQDKSGLHTLSPSGDAA